MLNLPPDVAGATLMAAGSSGPELATAIIGVFVAKVLLQLRISTFREIPFSSSDHFPINLSSFKDDIGVSGVIGSAVFNITLVIGVCSILAPTVNNHSNLPKLPNFYVNAYL